MGFGRPRISEAGSIKLNNTLTKIQINGMNGTGFFMKIEINGKTKKYLVTFNQTISQDQINSKINIDLFYDQVSTKIILDKNIRHISILENGVILIQIIQDDGIPENKFLSPDLNYKQGYQIYNRYRVCTIRYNENYTERQISSDEISLINDSKFCHNLDANLGSPICSLENQLVIGINKENHHGIFIGEILESLQKENHIKMNKIKFYYFDENKEKYILWNKHVLNQFHNQNNDNFVKALKDLEEYFSDIKDDKLKSIIDIFRNFQNIENYDEVLKNSIGVRGFLDKINTIIRMDNNDLSKKFYYFIAYFLNILEQADCKQRSELELFRGATMDYNRLLEYKNNINKLIFYKGFCPASKNPAAAATFGRAIGNTEDFNVIIRIKYKYKREWTPNCYDISKYDTFREIEAYLFTLFTCFKIKDVIIKENIRTAEILLESVGIKIDENSKQFRDVIYNENESFLEFV
jgi:hypothetical protein